jgi:TatD DNase family protein
MAVYFDSHCHLNDDKLYEIRAEVVKRALKENVKALFVIGYDLPSSIRAVEIANEFPSCYALVGYQPENLEGAKIEDLDVFRRLAKDHKVIGIGEIGLDHHWYKDPLDHKKQKEWFIRQINLANELDLPVSIHAREAIGDTLDILRDHPLKRSGVLHCYSGSVESLREFAKLGLYFGFDGPITYKNAEEPRRCVKECPLDRLLVETDSPYLAPVPFRGSINESKNIPLLVQKMAEIKGIEVEEIAEQMNKNLASLFHVKL